MRKDRRDAVARIGGVLAAALLAPQRLFVVPEHGYLWSDEFDRYPYWREIRDGQGYLFQEYWRDGKLVSRTIRPLIQRQSDDGDFK